MSGRTTAPTCRCIDFVKVGGADVWMASSNFRAQRSSPIVPRMPAIGEADSVKDLCELVSHANVVEVLDALSRAPMSFRELRSQVCAGRRALIVALRFVAARGLVTRTQNGSWDTEASADAEYRPTDRGRQVLDALSRFSVWTSMYDRAYAATDHC